MALPDDREIGRWNASGELVLLILHFTLQHFDLADPYALKVVASANDSFRAFHDGYQWRAMYYENAASAAPIALQSGFQAGHFTDEAALAALPPERRPALFMLTREQALAQMPGTTARNCFEWQPPRFRFNAAQRRLLSNSLFDENDEALMALLDVSVHGLKKLWRGIYERIEAAEPEFFGESASCRRRQARPRETPPGAGLRAPAPRGVAAVVEPMNVPRVPRLRYRKAQRGDIAECLALLPDWLQLDGTMRAALPELLERIANEAAVYSMVMEDVALPPGQRIQAWGLALALGPDGVARLRLNGLPQPLLARQAYAALLDGSLVPMDDTALGRVNASGELAFLAMHYVTRAYDPGDPYFQALISVGNESMRFGMSGHNLNAIHFENPVEADEVMRSAGFVLREAAGVREGLRLWGMTREEARRTMPGSTARHLFESHPPRFRLSVNQRRLLWHALFDEDDEQLAAASRCRRTG